MSIMCITNGVLIINANTNHSTAGNSALCERVLPHPFCGGPLLSPHYWAAAVNTLWICVALEILQRRESAIGRGRGIGGRKEAGRGAKHTEVQSIPSNAGYQRRKPDRMLTSQHLFDFFSVAAASKGLWCRHQVFFNRALKCHSGTIDVRHGEDALYTINTSNREVWFFCSGDG